MNSFIQFGAGLSAAVVIVWACLLLRKGKPKWGFVYAGILTAACAVLFVCGLLRKAPEKEGQTVPLSKEEWISFVYSFVEIGAYEEASGLVEEYSVRYGYDAECSLLTARIYALQGNCEAADGIYCCLSQSEDYASLIEQEYAYVSQRSNENTAASAMIRYLEKNGKDPAEYGYAQEAEGKQQEVTQETIAGAVFAAVKKGYRTKNFERTAQYVRQAEALYDKYAAEGTEYLSEEEIKEIKDVRKNLEKLKEKGEGAALTGCVREALLCMNLLLKDYKAVAENIDEYATYKELVLAAELYMEDVVKNKDFSEAYTLEYGEDTAAAGERLGEIYASRKADMEKAEAEELRLLVKFWKTGLKYPALTRMKNSLTKGMKSSRAGSDASKVYLALAKIEHYFENEKSRTGNLTEAVNSGYACRDEEYSSAMNSIYRVIHDSEAAGEIRNIPDYVEKVLDHAMPLEVYELLPSGEDGLSLYALEDAFGQEEAGDAQEKPAGEPAKEENEKEFGQVFAEYVSEVKSSITIGHIDTGEFETVKAKVVISSDYADNSKKLKEILSVYDCGLEITDFTVEKVTYDSVRTYLVCDVSGSMAGSIQNLREAVIKYINGRGTNEQIAICSFSGSIQGTVPFGSEDNALTEFANRMYAFGGTSIYPTLKSVLESFHPEDGSNNIVILMTDGEDGYRASYETIRTELAQLAREKNATVYTLGLGQVDTAYLSAIAESCRGKFVYVSDSTSLDTFYQLLHSQVDNQYILTYKAVDTLTGTDRTLEVSLSDGNVSDRKTYSLSDDVPDGAEDGQGPVVNRIFLRGLGVRTINKGNQAVKNTLLGSGFTPESQAVIRLLGDMKYTMELTYVNEGCYDFVVPAETAAGVYDVEVTIGGKKAVIKSGLSIADPGKSTKVTFGPYVFTAAQCIKNKKESITLRGNVVLNGWLSFKGDLVLKGDLENDTTIHVTDSTGSYVMFDADSATGLGRYFAENGIVLDIPAFNEFKLYYDADHMYDFEEYDVDNIRTPLLQVMQLLCFDSPAVKLYPDRLEVEYTNTEPHLPFQDVIFHSQNGDMFQIKCKGSAILNRQNFGILLEVKSEGTNKNYRQFTMFKAPVYLSMNDLDISIDTFKEEYSFGALVNLAFLDFGMGAKAAFKGFIPDKFTLIVDKDVNTTMGGIPLTFSKFLFGAEDIAPALMERDFMKLKIAGGMDIAAAKVSAFFPALGRFVGDISAFSMPDTKMELDLQPLGFSAEAKLNFLEKIQLLQAQLKIGTFEYSSELLEMDSATVSGLMAALKQGISWEIDDCKVDISATGEIDALSRFFGIQLRDARVLVDIKWWLFHKSIEKEADALLGLYFKENGDPQFMLILDSYEKDGKREKLCLYIDKNGNTGKENSMKKIK